MSRYFTITGPFAGFLERNHRAFRNPLDRELYLYPTLSQYGANRAQTAQSEPNGVSSFQ